MLKEVVILGSEPIITPKFIKTELLNISRDGQKLQWEMVKSLPTVHVLVNNIDSKELLLVKQVRPPVLYNRNSIGGECIEACAGLVDKYNHLDELTQTYLVAKEEIHEELGYATNNVVRLKTILSSVGMAGNKLHQFYAEVSDKDYVGQALEPTEDIEIVKVPHVDVLNFINTTSNTDSTTIMLLQWWLLNKGE